MFKVVYKFKDKQDNDYIYKVNDVYPRDGYKTNDKRIKELSTIKNKIGKILILEETEEVVEEQHLKKQKKKIKRKK